MIDDQLFETIYNEYKNLVFNLSLQYVLNTEDAQDITQEVFIKIYQAYHQFNPAKASLKTWIYQVTINQNLDFLKAAKAKKRTGFLSSIFHPGTSEPVEKAFDITHPGIIAEDREELAQLLSIIYSLPDNQKTALILTRIEGRPQQEVATIMNSSVKAIESLLQRAKKAIAKKIKESEG